MNPGLVSDELLSGWVPMRNLKSGSRTLNYDYPLELCKSSEPCFLKIELLGILQNPTLCSHMNSPFKKRGLKFWHNSAVFRICVFWIVTSHDFKIQNAVVSSGVLFLEIKALNLGRVLTDNQISEIWNSGP